MKGGEVGKETDSTIRINTDLIIDFSQIPNTTISGSIVLIKKMKIYKNRQASRAVVAHTFNPSTREAEAGGSLSLRPA